MLNNHRPIVVDRCTLNLRYLFIHFVFLFFFVIIRITRQSAGKVNQKYYYSVTD